MKAYRVVPVMTETGEYFSIAVSQDGVRERRLDVRFSTLTEAEAVAELLRQPPAPPEGGGIQRRGWLRYRR
jgi:hypothetical protein